MVNLAGTKRWALWVHWNVKQVSRMNLNFWILNYKLSLSILKKIILSFLFPLNCLSNVWFRFPLDSIQFDNRRFQKKKKNCLNFYFLLFDESIRFELDQDLDGDENFLRKKNYWKNQQRLFCLRIFLLQSLFLSIHMNLIASQTISLRRGREG